jgi:hypothetical protein
MKQYVLMMVAACMLYALAAQTTKPWVHLPQGPNAVGFTTMQVKGRQGDNLSIAVWYPANKGGKKMSLKDYIIEGRETPAASDTESLSQYKQVLELPFLFHLDKIPQGEFERAIATPFFAYKNAPVQKGKFPLVITYTSPESYPETFEYFASHGFVVACVAAHLPDITNDTLIYVHATDILEEFMLLMKQQPYVDTTRIAAFGHGWSIQPSFFLAMRTPAVKLLVNLDGAVFGPRSKTTFSPDYRPAALKIPMLHIISGETVQQEDINQFNILTNPRYRVMVNDSVSHHDFGEFGRVVDVGLNKRGIAAPLVEKVYAGVHEMMVSFLIHGKPDTLNIDKTLLKCDFFKDR